MLHFGSELFLHKQESLRRMGGLTQRCRREASPTYGLTRPRESAVQLARADASDVISGFGQMGDRRLAIAS